MADEYFNEVSFEVPYSHSGITGAGKDILSVGRECNRFYFILLFGNCIFLSGDQSIENVIGIYSFNIAPDAQII